MNTDILIAAICLGVGCLLFQIVLSRKPRFWVGLLLPAAALLFAGLAAFFAVQNPSDSLSLGAFRLVTFLKAAIPAAVLLAVYGVSRATRHKLREVKFQKPFQKKAAQPKKRGR